MRILVIGGDARMDCAAEKLSELYDTRRFGKAPSLSGSFDVIVLPLPLTKNGTDIFAPMSGEPVKFEIIEPFAEEKAVILAGGESPILSGICAERSYRLENYFSRETLTLKNAALTAESACAMLSQSTSGALLNSTALITGYGRIARFMAARLRSNGCSVTVAARRREQRVSAELDGFEAITLDKMSEALDKFEFIANTVPHTLFSEKDFSGMKKDLVFMELATLPEQPTRSYAEKYGISYIYASGLPGKCSPKKAGEFIAEEITNILENIDTAQLARPT